MSSYFVNSSFVPGAGGGGQAAADPPFLGHISLYSSGYTEHALRHYPGAAYSAAGADKAYPGSIYQQAAGGAYGGHRAGVGVVGGAACEYAAAAAAAATSLYRDKEPSSLEELAGSQDCTHRKLDCGGLAGKGLFVDTMDDKQTPTPIYPWMQRMNACNGECARLSLAADTNSRAVRWRVSHGRCFIVHHKAAWFQCA